MVIMINFFRYFWELFKNLKCNFWMIFVFVILVIIILFFVGLFLLVLLNVEKLIIDVLGNFIISVFLNVDLMDV